MLRCSHNPTQFYTGMLRVSVNPTQLRKFVNWNLSYGRLLINAEKALQGVDARGYLCTTPYDFYVSYCNLRQRANIFYQIWFIGLLVYWFSISLGAFFLIFYF